MESASTAPALLATAVAIGVVHTLLGPDHYLPFVALARSRAWSLARTWTVTAVCGLGHVLGSLALGGLGVGLGWALGDLVEVESLRSELAGWMLLGFGLAYLAWGVRQGMRGKAHSHAHAHADGQVHRHGHDHRGPHAHPHAAAEPGERLVLRRWLGPWALFVVFVLGPCEPLIPVLMYPAAQGRWLDVVAVSAVFAGATLATMLGVVTLGTLGVARLPGTSVDRWSQALAGAAIAACGVAVQLGL